MGLVRIGAHYYRGGFKFLFGELEVWGPTTQANYLVDYFLRKLDVV
jgi:hypothetical protein